MKFPPFSLAALLILASGPAWSQATTTPAETPAKPRSLFAPTPLIDIGGQKEFPTQSVLNDDAAGQLPGLCSLQEFGALPAENRHVYSFDPWPAARDDLGESAYAFNLKLGQTGVINEKVAFAAAGSGPGGARTLSRAQGADGRYSLQGFGNLNWNGTMAHTFTFDKPVIAFGAVLRSSADVEVRKFYWQAAVEKNGYPVSYTLSDGSVVNLGVRNERGALLKADTDAFLGVIDRSGRGIISVTYTLKGLAGNKAQSIAIKQLALATLPRPAVAPLINLRSACDFYNPAEIAPRPANAVPGLASLDDFRFIVGNHRYVYSHDTWTRPTAALGSNTGEFAFDLNGKGTVGQTLTVSAKNARQEPRLAQVTLTDAESLPYHALGGLGEIGQGSWAEQTFSFAKPVWAVGLTYRSPGEVDLGGGAAGGFPVSYTLADNTRIDLGVKGGSGGVIAANTKTFVGLVDKTGKGIRSITVRLQGRARTSQPVYVENVAFALAGPPPGEWKLTMSDEFDGDRLDPKHWASGYTFPDVINNELQGYVPENVTVANGLCTIKVEQRNVSNTDRTGRTGGAQKFASGAFTSYDKFTQTYGYFEARLKMPKARGAGIWPAFWVLPDRGKEYPPSIRGRYMTADYGRGMEIDIFEFMPRWQQPDGKFPVHMGCIWSYGPVTEKDPAPHGYGAYALDNDGWGPAELTFPHLDDEFHTYGLYWSPERLIFYIDSKPVFRVKDAKHIPDVPHYFLFNIAMSGNGWGKSPDKKHPTMQQIIDDLPNAMEIDYFRAYSGVLEEAVPPAPTDIPGPVTKYAPPPAGAELTPAPVAPANPAAPAGQVPPAPANVGIATPATG